MLAKMANWLTGMEHVHPETTRRVMSVAASSLILCVGASAPDCLLASLEQIEHPHTKAGCVCNIVKICQDGLALQSENEF